MAASETAELEFLVQLKDEATQALHGLEGVLKDVSGPLPDITAGIDIDASGADAAAKAAGAAADKVPEDWTGAGEDAGKGLGEGTKRGFDAGKAALLAGVAAVAVAAGKLFGDSLSDAMDVEQGRAKLTGQLNLTAEESARIGKLAGKVYAGNYGESLEEVNGAIASVVSSIQGMRTASDAELQTATQSALNFASAFDVEVSDAARSAGILLKTGMAADATEAFDLITAAAQAVGPSMVQPLLEASNEYATYFQALGFSGDQAFTALAQAAQGGEIALDKAGDAIKEFGIRATDGSQATASAYEDLGVNMNDTVNALLAGGPGAQAAMQTIVDALLSIKDPGTQAVDALALFGTPLEDIGVDKIPEFLKSLQAAGGGLGDVAGRADQLNATLGGTTASTLESVKRQFQQTFGAQLGATVLPILSQAIGLAGQFVTPLLVIGGALTTVALVMGVVAAASAVWSTAQTIGTAATSAYAAAQWVLNSAWFAAAAPIILVVALIAGLVAALVWFFTQTEVGQAIVTAVWNGIKTAISATVSWITGTAVPAVVAAWQWVVSTAQSIGSGVSAAWSAVVQYVQDAVYAVGAVVSYYWGQIVDFTTGIWNGITSFFAEWWPLLLAIFLPGIFLLLAAWNKWGDDIIAAAVATWNFVRDSIVRPVQEFVTAVVAKVTEHAAWLQAKWNEIVTIAKAAWLLLKTAVTQAITDTVLAVTTKLAEWGGWLSAKWTEYVALVRTAWALVRAAVVDPVVAFVADVAARLAGFAETVLRPIRAAKDQAVTTAKGFLTVGSAIIDGIIDGVTSAASRLASTVANAARSALDAAKGALGIHSPSRVFRDEVGAMMAAGWEQGLADSGADVVAAAEQIARDAAAGAADPGFTVGATSTATGPVSIASTGTGGARASAPSVVVAGYDGPSELVVRDIDGNLIGRMRVEAGDVMAQGRQDDLVDARARTGRGR